MADLTFDTQEAVPEDLREHSTAKDGKFVVAVAPKAKLDEFRTNNLAVVQDRDKFKGVIDRIRGETDFDPDKADDWFNSFKELKTVKEQVDNGKLVKDTSLDEAVGKKTTEMQRQHQLQVEALTTTGNNLKTENTALREQIVNMEIDNEVGAAASLETSGVRADAIPAVRREAREVFKMRDGKLVPLDRNGDIMYGSDGSSPMSPMEWIKTRLTTSAPYLFRESEGGGANGGKGGKDLGNLDGLSPAERMRRSREAQAGGR
jgi:hypothetical protein